MVQGTGICSRYGNMYKVREYVQGTGICTRYGNMYIESVTKFMKMNFQSYIAKTEVAGTSEMWQTAWRHARSLHLTAIRSSNITIKTNPPIWTKPLGAGSRRHMNDGQRRCCRRQRYIDQHSATLSFCSSPRSHCLVSPHQQSVQSTRCPTLLNTTRWHSNVRVLGQTPKKKKLRHNLGECPDSRKNPTAYLASTVDMSRGQKISLHRTYLGFSTDSSHWTHCCPVPSPHSPGNIWSIYGTVGRAFLFPVDRGSCPVLSDTLSELLLHEERL